MNTTKKERFFGIAFILLGAFRIVRFATGFTGAFTFWGIMGLLLGFAFIIIGYAFLSGKVKVKEKKSVSTNN